jgi:putative alpha-1,2-mannosidase
LDNTTYWQKRIGNDTAKVGYFKTQLENGVTVELSGARHAGILEYGFASEEKHVLVDVSHYLPDENGGDCTQYYVDGEIKISDDGKSYTGHGTYAGGWNLGAPYTVYFCADFDIAPTEARAFNGANASIPNLSGKSRKAADSNDGVGALFSWRNSSASSIRSRIGISLISVDKACTFKESEVPSWELNDAVAAAVDEWNKDVFSRIRVDTGEGANQTNLILLYSSLYFMHLMPSNRTGENPKWQSDEPSWDDFYTFCKWSSPSRGAKR